MSKRFGRNQKRRLQQQITTALARIEIQSQARVMAEGLANHMRRELDEARDIIRRVSFILGDNFIGLPVQTHSVSHIQERYRIHHKEEFCAAMRMPDARAAMEFTHIAIEEIQGNRLQTQRDTLRRMIHIRYQTPKGDVAYALSQDAWLMTPCEVLEYRLCQDIAEQLVRHLIRDIRK